MRPFSSKVVSLLLLTTTAAILLLLQPSSAVPTPIRYHCDMCETNWLHCIMKCHMEEYMTRHSYK